MNSENICEYCDKNFSTKSNLKNHQIKAKFCLNKRDEINDCFKCDYCDKILASKFRLDAHYPSCKQKLIIKYENDNKELNLKILLYEKQLQDKDNLIDKLQNQVLDLATKAIEKPSQIYNSELSDNRTINNSNNRMIDNRILNMVPMNLTQDSIFQALEEKFTENHLMKGQKGLAEFCIENILITPENKFLMKCTDASRKTFVYIDEEGKIQKDINADRFTKMLTEPVKNITRKIYTDIQNRFFDSQNLLEDDEEEDEERLNYATDKVVEITSLKNNNTEFVKNLIPSLS